MGSKQSTSGQIGFSRVNNKNYFVHSNEKQITYYPEDQLKFAYCVRNKHNPEFYDCKLDFGNQNLTTQGGDNLIKKYFDWASSYK